MGVWCSLFKFFASLSELFFSCCVGLFLVLFLVLFCFVLDCIVRFDIGMRLFLFFLVVLGPSLLLAQDNTCSDSVTRFFPPSHQSS